MSRSRFISRALITFTTIGLVGTTVTGVRAAEIPADRADLTLPGPSAQQWFGSSVRLTSDLSGNGRADLIVGAPLADPIASTGPGRAFVYEGATGTLLFTFEGEVNGDRFGSAVTGIGDLTGNGAGDLLIGAPGNDAGGTDAGRAYVYSGETGQLIRTHTGEEAGDWFGFSVTGVGDVNGDGVPDYLIGARAPQNDRLGFAYLHCGATGDLLHRFEGEQPGTHYGASVAGGGDITGNGTPDLMVGAPFHPAPGFFGGRAYAYAGDSFGELYQFSGEGQSNFFGISIAIVGDTNGDGHAEMLIGADGNGSAATNAGRAYLYSGKDGELLNTWDGTETGGRLGRNVAPAGDVGGDGFADLLIGQPSPGGFFGGSGTGRAFVISGATGETLRTYAAAETDDFFGFNLHGGLDASGNGGPDHVISAYASDIGGTQSGRVDLFFGDDPAPGNPADLNDDGVVNVFDLLILLENWGPCPPNGDSCPADLTGNGIVNVFDLLALLEAWG